MDENNTVTYEQFRTRVEELLIEHDQTHQLRDYTDIQMYGARRGAKPPVESNLYVEWSTGGMTGGNCWEDSDPRPYTSDEAPQELTSLDIILENVSPNLTFLQYKGLTNQLIKITKRSVNEYYGNYTDYLSKRILLKELYDYLVSKKWL